MRLVAEAIKHLSVDDALRTLQVTQKRAARPLQKTLQSAVANAVNNAKLERATLVIQSIMVNEGQALKRFHPSTRGRIHPYKKRSSTVNVVLKSVSAPASSKPVEEKKASEPVVEKEEKKSILKKALAVGKRGKK